MNTSDHPLVDQALSLENPSIGGNLFSGRDHDHVIRLEILDRNFKVDTIRLGVASLT